MTLYRKYRPKNFSEVVGQEHIIKTLSNAVASDNIVHAYLFSGIRGTGKTSLARIFAKSVNCEQKKENGEACNKCPSCLSIADGRAVDLIEVDAASYTGIDDIRELINRAYLLPTQLRYKVFIIDECHQLSKHAINALLKTLEEPPSYVIFILVTTELHKIIPTILSRCQSFIFWKVGVADIIKRLDFISKQENIAIDQKALEIIALNSGGSVRDSESLLGQVLTLPSSTQGLKIEAKDIKNLLGLIEISLISELIDLIEQKKEKEIIVFLREINKKGVDFQEFIKVLINYIRQILVFKISKDSNLISGLTNEEIAKLEKQAEKLPREKIIALLKSLLKEERNIRYSPNQCLSIELAILEYILEY